MAKNNAGSQVSRLDRLEENGYFLEKSVKELEGCLKEQQALISRLEADMASCQRALARIAAFMDFSLERERSPEAEQPPHWTQRDWRD